MTMYKETLTFPASGE